MNEPEPVTLPDVLAYLSKRWTPRLNVYGPVIDQIEKYFEIKEPSTESPPTGQM